LEKGLSVRVAVFGRNPLQETPLTLVQGQIFGSGRIGLNRFIFHDMT
jgi:hypothetical protein